MTGAERGFVLLCSHLGDTERKCLTTAQFRRLRQRMARAQAPQDQRELTTADLCHLGYSQAEASQMTHLLSEDLRLEHYLRRASASNIRLLTPFSGAYPRVLEARLGDDAPAVLWVRGDLELLAAPKISLVGSRMLREANHNFAQEAGFQAARQGYCLVSGNARGADRTAQDACLAAGGRVLSVLPDSLVSHTPRENTLYLCEDSFDLPFSPLRALSRNRLIHALGQITLVAQSSLKTGGTWDGSVKNLRFRLSPLYCFADGQESTRLLTQMGAQAISREALADFSALPAPDATLI